MNDLIKTPNNPIQHRKVYFIGGGIASLASAADRTPYNQFDSLTKPLIEWLKQQGVQFEMGASYHQPVFNMGIRRQASGCVGNIGKLTLIGQFAEAPDDVVFTVEFSVRTMQTAFYEIMAPDKKPNPMYGDDHHI